MEGVFLVAHRATRIFADERAQPVRRPFDRRLQETKRDGTARCRRGTVPAFGALFHRI